MFKTAPSSSGLSASSPDRPAIHARANDTRCSADRKMLAPRAMHYAERRLITGASGPSRELAQSCVTEAARTAVSGPFSGQAGRAPIARPTS